MGLYKHGFGGRDYGSVKRRFYDRWQYVMTRCFNKNRAEWKNYGGRGISVSAEWRHFPNFQRDMWESFLVHYEQHGALNTTLERQDCNADYSKENCHWATRREQNRNRRRQVMVMFRGKMTPIWDVVAATGRHYMTVYSRAKRGVSMDAPFRKPRLPITPDKGGIARDGSETN